MLTAGVRLEAVTVRYGERVALAAASAEAEPGSLVCLVGLNGAGKSSLLKAVVGTVASTGGIWVNGVSGRERRLRLAYVPQREAVNWGFPISVLEVVLLGRMSTLRRIGPDPAADREAALAALTEVGMAEFRRRPIGELSGGQQQRVVLARALFAGARVMLLHEPLSGVDPATRALVLRVLRELCDRGGTVLMATHDVVEAASVADRVWGLDRALVADVEGPRLLDEEVLRSIYGESLLVLAGDRVALGDQAR